jgi:ribosome-associated toxin RatA of RatAB toxin-antitoxin module
MDPRRLLLAIALLAVLPAHASAVEVRSQRDGEAIAVTAAVTVPAHPALVWSVLTDYDHYAAFVPDMQLSRVRGRDARGLIVEQRGRVRFLFFSHGVEVTFAVVEEPQRAMSSVAIAGSFRELAGRYELERVSGGTRLSYVGRAVPGDGLPLWLVSVALGPNVERHIAALVHEIARRGETAGSGLPRPAGAAH